MRKLILLSVLMFQIALSFGQGIQLFTEEGDEITNGQTIEVMVDFEAWEAVTPELFAKNNFNHDIELMIRVNRIYMVEGTMNNFCGNGQCYGPGTMVTPHSMTIAAGVQVGDEGVFTAHYQANNHEGTSLVRYTFYDDNSVNDSISFVVKFNGGEEASGESLEMYTEEGDQIENGATVTVDVDFAAWEAVTPELFVKNASTSDIDVMIRVEEISVVDETTNNFCGNGQCYGPGTMVTPHSMTVAAGVIVGEEGVFTSHYQANNHDGITLLRYTFFDENNVNDTTSFFVKFDGSTGINDIDENAVITAYPNPNTGLFNIQYNLTKINQGELVVYNAIGSRVVSRQLIAATGTMTIDMQDMPKGIYLYRFEGDAVQSKTYKIVIK